MNVLYFFVTIIGFMWDLRAPLRPVRRCWYFWRPCWARRRGTRSTWAVGPNCSTETNEKKITALSRYSSLAIFSLKLYSSVVSSIFTELCNHQYNLILKHPQLPFLWGGGGMGGMLLCHSAGRILVPPPGIEPGLLAVTAQSPNHWTTRELPQLPHDDCVWSQMGLRNRASNVSLGLL